MGSEMCIRDSVERHPPLRAAIAREHPDGPLAINHLRGRTKIPSRYDFLFASPDLEIVDADVVWDPAGTKLSDHGLVWAELRLAR